MIWNIFDRWGNKLGELHPQTPDDGCGCAIGSILFLIIGLGSVLIWPILLMMLFTHSQAWIGVVQIVSLVAALAIYGYKKVKSPYYSFIGVWLSLMSSATIISSAVSWLVSGLKFIMLFACLFVSFLLSIGGSLIAAIIVARLRRDN